MRRTSTHAHASPSLTHSTPPPPRSTERRKRRCGPAPIFDPCSHLCSIADVDVVLPPSPYRMHQRGHARQEERRKRKGTAIHRFASVRRYVAYARDDAELGAMMCGAVRRQARLVLLSRWSNAFNYDSSGHGRSAGSAMRMPTVSTIQKHTHMLTTHTLSCSTAPTPRSGPGRR